MQERDKRERREDVFSKAVRAGKRTYFFDVKSTKGGENFITITESKKMFNTQQGKFYFEKHKVFLYKEDFDKFSEGFQEVLEFVRENQGEIKMEDESLETSNEKGASIDLNFEDLGKEDKTDI